MLVSTPPTMPPRVSGRPAMASPAPEGSSSESGTTSVIFTCGTSIAEAAGSAPSPAGLPCGGLTGGSGFESLLHLLLHLLRAFLEARDRLLVDIVLHLGADSAELLRDSRGGGLGDEDLRFVLEDEGSVDFTFLDEFDRLGA
jgi:hypothetical protein